MDFSKVKIVEKANPRKPEVIKAVEVKPTFHLKVDYKNEKMTFSTALAEQIGLGQNSLAQGEGENGEILLIVMPGNTGIFAKNQSKGDKGRSFKNKNFVGALTAKGWLGGKFNLELVGDHEGAFYHQVVPFGSNEAVVETAVEEGPKDDAAELVDEQQQGIALPEFKEEVAAPAEVQFN